MEDFPDKPGTGRQTRHIRVKGKPGDSIANPFRAALARAARMAFHRISVLTACHAKRRVGDRFSLADGTSGRRLEPVPFPEHEPAPSAFGRNLIQPSPFGMKTFPKVFQVVLDFFFRPMDGGGDLHCRVRPLLQESADLSPCGFRFLPLPDCGRGIHPRIIARLLSRRISCGEGNPFVVSDDSRLDRFPIFKQE